MFQFKGVFRDLQVCSETRKPPFYRLKIVYKVDMYENFFDVLRGSGYAGSHRETL